MVKKSQDGSYDCLLVSPTFLLGDACKKGIDHSYQPLLDSPPPQRYRIWLLHRFAILCRLHNSFILNMNIYTSRNCYSLCYVSSAKEKENGHNEKNAHITGKDYRIVTYQRFFLRCCSLSEMGLIPCSVI